VRNLIAKLIFVQENARTSPPIWYSVWKLEDYRFRSAVLHCFSDCVWLNSLFLFRSLIAILTSSLETKTGSKLDIAVFARNTSFSYFTGQGAAVKGGAAVHLDP